MPARGKHSSRVTDVQGYNEVKVRSGRLVISFLGRELGHSSSARPGAPRWSELTLYQTAKGEFMLEKVGRSTVAHRPDCQAVNHRMEHGDGTDRSACILCQPDLTATDLRLEPQRYTVYQQSTLAGIIDVLVEGRDKPPALVTRLIEQAIDSMSVSM